MNSAQEFMPPYPSSSLDELLQFQMEPLQLAAPHLHSTLILSCAPLFCVTFFLPFFSFFASVRLRAATNSISSSSSMSPLYEKVISSSIPTSLLVKKQRYGISASAPPKMQGTITLFGSHE